nr:uncharacterized mitochondrial protein AtMg00810-like [Tanacetum cinerariifolium]
MRPFGCPVTILNTLDHLCKFDGKDDEGFFVRYSVNSKAFKLFDIDTLTKSTNYKPVVTWNQSNGSAGKARVETVLDKNYILIPLWTQDPLFSSSSKDSPGDGFKQSREEEEKDDEDLRNKDNEVLSTEEPRVNQEKEANVNSTNNFNIVSPTANTASIKDNVVDKNIVYGCADDPNMPNLEDIVYSDDDEDVGAEADMNNLDTNILVSPIITTRIHKDHLVEQIIRDIHSSPQTKRMTKSVTDHGLQVTQKDDGIFTSQDKYVDEILKKFGFLTVKTASTPMETSKPLMKDENAEDVDLLLYRSMIGSLMNLTSLKPDIMFVVSYTDSDYAGANLDRKSITEGCQFLRSRLISWQCKKQTVVANSTTEAELYTNDDWNEVKQLLKMELRLTL